MSVSVDSFASAQAKTVATLVWNHTLVAGANNSRTVLVRISSTAALSSLAITFDGKSMSSNQSIAGSGVAIEEFVIHETNLPAIAGTYSVSATWTGNDNVVGISVATTDTRPGSPFTQLGTGSGSGGTGFAFNFSAEDVRRLHFLTGAIDSNGNTDMIERFGRTETVEDATGSASGDVRSSITHNQAVGFGFSIGYDWQVAAGFVFLRGVLTHNIGEIDVTGSIAGVGAVVGAATTANIVTAAAVIQGIGAVVGSANGIMEGQAVIQGIGAITGTAVKIPAALSESGWWGAGNFW